MKRLSSYFVAAALAVGAFLAGWAFWWEPSSVTVRHARIPAPELSGLRIAVLADLHIGSPYHGLETLREIVRRTNAERPDLILLPGDFVIQGVVGGDFVHPDDAAPVLAQLEAPLGVWAVMGNHDHWFDGENPVPPAFERNGIPLLEDRAVLIERTESPFWLVGVSDLWESDHDVRKALSGVEGGQPVMLFTHNPDLFPEIPSRVSLTVAGHTHGGQVNFPVLGRLIVPSKFGERYAAGLIVEDGRKLFVSTGLGTSILPVRFRVPPVISILELE